MIVKICVVLSASKKLLVQNVKLSEIIFIEFFERAKQMEKLKKIPEC